MLSRRSLLAAGGATILLSACGGGGGGGGYQASALATTASGRVVIFEIDDPDTLNTNVALTGLLPGDSVAGLDGRPADGRIYVLGKLGNIYTLNSSTGVLTFQVALTADPADATSPYAGLTGTQFATDFNPVADRLRVVSDSGQNLRINVATGLVITDGDINGVPGAVITGAAYSNNFAGAVSTTLYVIDAAAGVLYIQAPPNNGTISSPVTLGVSGTTVNGFDIDIASPERGYAALTVGGVTNLYRISLSAASNAATLIGTIGTGADPVTGFLRLD